MLVSIEPEPTFFVINSTVNEYIRRREWLNQCQVEIGPDNHPFLRHHSFVECTTAHKIALRDVYEQIERDIGRLKDDISAQVRDQIIAAVKFTKTLSAKQKTDILSSLEAV